MRRATMHGDRAQDAGELLALIQGCPRELVPAVLVALAARLASEPGPTPADSDPGPPPRQGSKAAERWLTVAQVAERLGRDARWVYRRAHRWPFVAREGRSLLFNERGLVAYMERHRLEP